MKKLILTLSIAFMLFCSCTSNDALETKNSSSRISSVLNEKNYESQKLMYQLLSKEEKHKIWTDKIDILILDSSLSDQQINLLNDLKNHLNNNLFDKTQNNDDREVFKTIYAKDFLSKAKNLFSYKYIYENFFTINGNISLSKTGTPPLPVCSCNQGSIFSCAGISADCKATDKCRNDSDGCGFLGMFECNGNCYLN